MKTIQFRFRSMLHVVQEIQKCNNIQQKLGLSNLHNIYQKPTNKNNVEMLDFCLVASMTCKNQNLKKIMNIPEPLKLVF